MSGRRAIAAVARREITSRVRERSFLISTSVTILLLLFAGAAPALFGAGDPVQRTVSAAGGEALQVARDAARAAPSLDVDLDVEQAASPAAARAAVRDGDADVALIGDPPAIVVDRELDDSLGSLLQQAAAARRQAAVLEGSDLPPDQRDALLRPPPLAVDVLDPGAEDDEEREGVAMIATILLYGQLLLYGYWIAAGIVEEKASRVVEVLLSAISPRDLLLGKLLGIGVLGFAQLLLVLAPGAAMVAATGALEVPSTAWAAVGVVLAFFVGGYAVYAALFSVAGAVVPRQEDLQSSTTPLTTLAIVSFFAAIAAAGEPDGTLAQVVTFVPPCTPMVLPVRIFAGDVAAWEVAVAVAVMLATAAALVAVSIRIYTGAILRTGGRVRLAEAWRPR